LGEGKRQASLLIAVTGLIPCHLLRTLRKSGGFSGIVLAGDDVKSGLELDFSRVVVALVIENLKFTDVHLSRL